MAKTNYNEETHILRAVASNPRRRFKWTRHALLSLEDDTRTTQDIEDGLTNCQVVLVETAKRDILWRAMGQDLDGKKFEAVVAVFEDEILIKVVTTF